MLERLAAYLSPARLLNALAAIAPVSLDAGIAYGPSDRHRLDIYRPRAAGPHPLAVFIYGGGWEEGDRETYRFVGSALASAGIVTVIPDYRVYPEVRFPGFIEDGAAGVRWAYKNAASFGADPEQLVLIGHSAGAHIAAMLALDPQWLRAERLPNNLVRGLVGLAGPYDFHPDTPTRRIIFGLDRDRTPTQPISFARHDAPPALLVSGRGDRVVDPGNATRLARRLDDVGAWAEVKFYPHASHESLIGAFSPALRFVAPVFRDTVDFIARTATGQRAYERATA